MSTNSIDVMDEIKQNFLDSSYDVNANRAFPKVQDGLKPGMRACLWEMYTKGYTSNKPHVKSAKIDGGVAALWWPHGTTALYETFVRMSQPFTNNVPEVDFHGANGNIILGGDAYAADRYTEARLAKITEEGMFAGIDKNNVDMILNFSEDEFWPEVLPAVFPRLLVNGSQGIGVSLAQTWLPHNFKETSDLITKYINTGELDTAHYYPDFPTGGTIINQDDLGKINTTGKGKVIIEANYRIEKNEIIFYEMPYQVYIEPVIEKIRSVIEDGGLTGIKGVYNKSDKKRIALVIECNQGVNPETVVSELFQTTPLRSQYNANQNAIVSKTPVLLNLQEVLDIYIEHNTNCIKREFEYDVKKLSARLEIVDGLLKALASIDDIIAIIRNSEDTAQAQQELMKKYDFSESQAQAILNMKLARLSKLDGVELSKEQADKQQKVAYSQQVVENQSVQKDILVQRLSDLAKKYGSERRSQLENKVVKKGSRTGKNSVDKIENVVITYNPLGYLQNIPLTEYRNNGYQAFKMTTADLLLIFTNHGRFFRVAPKDIKRCGVRDKGTALGAILSLEQGEKVLGIFDNTENETQPYLLFAMKNGMIKKTEKTQYIGNTRNVSGMMASKSQDTEIIAVLETNGNDVILETKDNMRIRFFAEEVRAAGKATSGVKGINLHSGDYVVKCDVIGRNDFKEIAIQKRGGKGKKF